MFCRDARVIGLSTPVRKERTGTKLSTTFIPATVPDWVEKQRAGLPFSYTDSTGTESKEESGDDTMEKRLKSCYTDDTYGELCYVSPSVYTFVLPSLICCVCHSCAS